jgi:uncharacterized protein (DUF58 family)
MTQTAEKPLLTALELEQLQRQTLHLQARRRRAVAGQFSGPELSVFRGRGMELEDLRAYQPGDDVRHMEWRATARSGRPITKVFREERQRLVYLVIDRGPTMAFGTRREIKAATAARIAALLAFSALARQERVAGLICDNDGERCFPAARGLDGVLRLLRAAVAPIGTTLGTSAVQLSLERLDRVVERGSAVYLISDFQGLDAKQRPLLRHLAERCELSALQVVDPAEEDLGNAGRLRLRGTNGRLYVVDSGDARLRERYAAAMAARQTKLKRMLHGAGVGLLRVTTQSDTLRQLDPLL